MLSFVVFEGGSQAKDWALKNAHLLEEEGICCRGTVAFEDGVVRCERAVDRSTALAVQWDCGELGKLTLRTCLLPHREEPYLLSLELARRQIQLFLTKLEDWGRVELPAQSKAMQLFEQARHAFIPALSMGRLEDGGYSPEQNARAQEALGLALNATEELAIEVADEDLGARLAQSRAGAGTGAGADGQGRGETAPRPQIGCAIFGDRFTPALREIVAGSFDFITAPMRWVDIEAEEGRYDYSKTDRWVEWAVRSARMPVAAGPVIDLDAHAAPEWLFIWENDFSTLQELVFEHVKRVVTRYRKAVKRWTITSGLQTTTAFPMTIEQSLSLTRVCALAVRKLQSSAKIQVEIAQPFGEYAGETAEQTLPPPHYAELLLQAGVPVDSFGLRVQMGEAKLGHSTRDMATLSDMFDSFGKLERAVAVSMIGAPSAPGEADPDRDDLDGGSWMGGWSDATQAQWMARAVIVALSKPFITGVCWQELYDHSPPGGMPRGGLISESGQRKEALRRLAEIHRRLQTGAAQGASV